MTVTLHQHTPSLISFDPRGLAARVIAYHRIAASRDAVTAHVNRRLFNALGQLAEQWDPRLFELNQGANDVRPNRRAYYNLRNQELKTASVDAGWRVAFSDAAGLLLERWDGRGTHLECQYDQLMRPAAVFEQMASDGLQFCTERFTYAANDHESAQRNRCGQMVRHDDTGGSLWHEQFGIQGQPLEEKRRFLQGMAFPGWPDAIEDRDKLLETVKGSTGDNIDVLYTTQWRQDALGAVIEQTDAVGHVQRFGLDIAGLASASHLDGITLLKSIQYDASGQVEIERAGNDVVTTAGYSAVDGQLYALKATKPDGTLLQHLQYEYDPVGNIERIEDLAQPTQWFAQRQVEAISTYTYDSLYQLTSATGRENASQSIGPALPGLELFGTPDDSRWRHYTQRYTYDSGGNLTDLKHEVSGAVVSHRRMAVDMHSNRGLFKESEGAIVDFSQGFDVNGNQQALAPGQIMQWDARNQLCQVTQVVREEPNGQDDDVETYVYDGGGQRVRKVRRAKTRGGEQISEVRYLPGLEIRTRTTGEHMHVVSTQAGRNGVRLLHWEAKKPDEIDNNQLRYSLSDHLGSCTLELDQSAELLSHESYYPYGGTSWWAASNGVEAKYKTVRYSGKERDATGLYYYGFRYYAPWLQRWINPDPAGAVDGLSLFCYARNSPVVWIDADGKVSKKFRGQPGDRVETQVLSKNSSTEFIARGLKEFEGLGEEEKTLSEKIRKSQNLAVAALESAIKNLSMSERSQMTNAILKSFLCVTDITDENISTIKSGFSKLLEIQKSRLEDGNDQIVIYENSENNVAFAVRGDEHGRMFIKSSAIGSSGIVDLSTTLIHEDSHFKLKAMDIFYMPRLVIESASSERELVAALKPAMITSFAVAKDKESSPLLEKGGGFVAVKDKLESKGIRATIDKIFLKNADTWAFLAIGLGGYQVLNDLKK